MAQSESSRLQIHKTTQADLTYLQFEGTVDETFNGEALGSTVQGQLVISLAEIRRITSFGIRQWMEFINKAGESCAEIYLVECAPRIVDQLNMVANFAGKGVVVSFYAPFRCDYCGEERLKLIQMDQERDAIRQYRLEGGQCPNDAKEEYFDDDPDAFLSYLANQPDFVIDPRVLSFLASRTSYAVPDGLRKVRIEKKIKDRYTFINIAGDLGEDLPVGKMAEGLEGDVVLDLSGVGRASPEGMERWRSLLTSIAPTTEKLMVIGFPNLMLEGFSRKDDLAEKGQVLSAMVPYACQSCAVTSQTEVDVTQHHDKLLARKPPDMECGDCGRTASCVASVEMLAGLAELPKPAPGIKTGKLIEWAREVPQQPKLQASPSAAAPARVPAPSRGLFPILAMASLAVFGAAIAIYLVLTREATSEAATGGLAKGARLVEASHPKPPNWRDQSFTVKGDQVLVTGRSGFVLDKEDGFNTSREAGLESLCHQVAVSIRDPKWVEHVGGQFQSYRAKAIGDLEKAITTGDDKAIKHSRKKVREKRKLVARSLLKGASTIVQPERSQFYWEKLQTSLGVRYRVWSLFRVSKRGFKRLVDHYSKREEALGAQIVTLFPGMGWRYKQTDGIVVLALKPNSSLRFIGIAPGDIIVSAQDRVIKDAHGFKRVMRQEHEDLTQNGGTMTLRVQRGDGQIIGQRLQVVKQSGKTSPTKPRWRWKKRPPTTKDKPPANIWDDSIYE